MDEPGGHEAALPICLYDSIHKFTTFSDTADHPESFLSDLKQPLGRRMSPSVSLEGVPIYKSERLLL